MGEEEEKERKKKINLELSLSFNQLPLKRKASDALHSSQGQNRHFGVVLNEPSLFTPTSSALSDNYRSNSTPGGNSSSDTNSNSSSHRVSSPSVNEPASSQKETHLNHNQRSEKITSTNKTQCEKTCTLDKQSSQMPRSPSPKEAKVVTGKPPKPNRQKSQRSVLLPQMPCVSATGNGPNGKTINGFLYKYSKTEVSIVCVCHGTSFSPASFVEHAGGVDIEHPLKHIRVVPFALS